MPAVKSYVGHTISVASGDQLISALGTFKYDIIPGIKTVTKIAADVSQERVLFPLQDMSTSDRQMSVVFVNSKGFGGNNATAVVLSPKQVEKMLAKRYSQDQISAYVTKRDRVREQAQSYAERADAAQLDVIYRFGEALIDQDKMVVTEQGISIPGFSREVEFDLANPYSDMQ